nr:sulfite exporter TauE/SafE family protein [Shewanella vesiculosa]
MIQAIIGALLIGLVLSVLGSGGSIITVPVLLYLIGMQPQLAIASSLCIVGVISLISSMRFIKHKKSFLASCFLIWFTWHGGDLLRCLDKHFCDQ